MTRINKSWREQRKAIIAYENDVPMEFISLWEASCFISRTKYCKRETAKKEIRKAIDMGVPRYGMKWQWKE